MDGKTSTAILAFVIATLGLGGYEADQYFRRQDMKERHYGLGSVCDHQWTADHVSREALYKQMVEEKPSEGDSSAAYKNPADSIAGKEMADFKEKQQAEFDNIVLGLQAANKTLGDHPLFCDGGAISNRGWLLKQDYEGALDQRMRDDSSVCAREYSEDVFAYLKNLYPCSARSFSGGLGG
jgi:hypothetical protein